jgi:hypothetical protein
VAKKEKAEAQNEKPPRAVTEAALMQLPDRSPVPSLNFGEAAKLRAVFASLSSNGSSRRSTDQERNR